MFFALHGKFILHEDIMGEHRTTVREYTQVERKLFEQDAELGFSYAPSLEP